MFNKRFIVFLMIICWICRCSNNPTEPDEVNNKPEIVSLFADKIDIGKGQSTTLSVLAEDKDKDELTYVWSSTGGLYLDGNTRKYAKWSAPNTLGEYICKVSVSDGKDTVEDSLLVSVVEVPLLRLSTTAIDFSYNKSSESVTISNSGKGELKWKVISGKNWIKTNTDSGTTSTGVEQITITIDKTNLNADYYIGSIMVESNGGNIGIQIEMAVPLEPIMISVPAGEFFMGSETGRDDELPLHTVYLDEFRIDKYEVTNAQYNDFLNNALAEGFISASLYGAKKDGQKLISLQNVYKDGWNLMCPIDFDYVNYTYSVNSLEANTPVRFVTWYGAKAYADYYGKRLPTEAEWEKAAKGTGRSNYPWGDSEPTRWDCNYEDVIGHTVWVGNYSPLGMSPYGCCDLSGNVWEWCSSKYKEYPYNALDGREDKTGSSNRIIRGGSWVSHSETLRCAARCYCEPFTLDPYFGFRCVQ
jgi:formylglycine-generating enzyme required for sulfatase activity